MIEEHEREKEALNFILNTAQTPLLSFFFLFPGQKLG